MQSRKIGLDVFFKHALLGNMQLQVQLNTLVMIFFIYNVMTGFSRSSSAMADVVTRGGEILANIAMGTPCETVAKDVGISIGTDTRAWGLREQIIQDIDKLVDEIKIWVISSRKMLP